MSEPALADPAGASQASRPRWTARLVLIAWWLAMFTATHLPIQETLGEPPIPDKLAHFGVYLVLGLLLPMWTGWRTRLNWRRAGLCLGVLLAYAVVDELTQIPVGRSAEWLDGLADLCGGSLGVAVAALIGNNRGEQGRLRSTREVRN